MPVFLRNWIWDLGDLHLTSATGFKGLLDPFQYYLTPKWTPLGQSRLFSSLLRRSGPSIITPTQALLLNVWICVVIVYSKERLKVRKIWPVSMYFYCLRRHSTGSPTGPGPPIKEVAQTIALVKRI
ncbi:hypothetical protein M408DRAFT_139092 [Serendipita vermifera MAFF 305830]|uniref:Uncharacterized protein n=1 Tax=Serendipita vermifera MAFF 305830 TaxID=933852 RepID=A0A0C3AM22_SERVB|nr:hypothetical protein M408DRAFT_139092 [Serendipita vermifera MAFF 305830]